MNQDPDAPLPTPIVHGLYYSVPPTLSSIPISLLSPSSLPSESKIGANRRGTTYMPPRPLMGHGPHRYFYQVIALRKKLDLEGEQFKVTLEQVLETLKKEDIVAWGEWVGVAERKL